MFRELLQNSDDARSSAVEIRFETAAYLRRKDGEQGNIDVPSFPNLKSAHVRLPSVIMPSYIPLLTSLFSRLPNGRLETTESLLETRIGHDCARSVGDLLFYSEYSFSDASGGTIAEGNPDEEKIGAFGVGERHHFFHQCRGTNARLGFYSLFSVTENPFVSSGGIPFHFFAFSVTRFKLGLRAWNAILLEG